MRTEKKLPYEKTVVSELKVTLADLLTRNVVLRSSSAAPVPSDLPYHSGDAIVTLGQPLNIPSTAACVVLSSFENFEVVFPGPEEVVLTCRGLFVHNGSSGRIVVRPIPSSDSARIQYIWA